MLWNPIKTIPVSKALADQYWVLIYCVPAPHRDPRLYPARQYVASKVHSLSGDYYYFDIGPNTHPLDECVYTPTHWAELPRSPV